MDIDEIAGDEVNGSLLVVIMVKTVTSMNITMLPMKLILILSTAITVEKI